MASLSKKQLNLIANVVVKRVTKVSYNRNWQSIFALFEIGEVSPSSKYLEFSSKDWDLLREMALKDSGHDVLALDFNQTREQVSKIGRNDKLAKLRPDANYVLVKLPAKVELPLGLHSASHRLTVEDTQALITELNIKALLVVENLDSFDDIVKFYFDDELSELLANTLVVYRGSGAHSPAGRKRLLAQIAADPKLSNQVTIYAFTDLDPAGIQIATLLPNCQGCLLPVDAMEHLDDLSLSASLADSNYPHDFHCQYKQLAHIKKSSVPSIQELTNFIERHQISIKQQHMLAKKMALRLYRF